MSTVVHITDQALELSSIKWDVAYNTATVYQANSTTYATNTGLNAVSSVLLPTSVFQNISSSFAQNNYVNSNFLFLTGGNIDGSVTINGNFFVIGTASYINVTDFQVQDPLLYLGLQNPEDILDLGFVGGYRPIGDPIEHRHTGLIRNYQDKKWTLFSNLSVCPLSGTGPNLELDDSSIVIDTLRANLEGNLTTNTDVSGNLTVNGILRANSSGATVARFNQQTINVPMEIVLTDEGLATGYPAPLGSIGVDTQGLKVRYGNDIGGEEWGEVLYLDKNDNGLIARNKLSLGTASLLASSDFAASNLYKNLSGNWQNTYTTVQNNSSNWDYQGTDIKQLSTNWEQTYILVENNSSTNWSYQGTDLKQLSSNWQNTYTTVQSNSSDWNYQGTDLKQLSSNWQSTFVTVCALSATWNLPSTDLVTVANYLSTNNIVMQTVSAISLSGTFFGNGSNLTGLTLPGQQNINTVVQNGSGDWNSNYTTVQSNSANWQTAYNTATSYSNVSGTFATRDFVDNKFLPLSGGTVTGQLNVTNVLSSTQSIVATSVNVQIVQLPDIQFNGRTINAVSLTGTNIFTEVTLTGGIKKYIQLFDITPPLLTYFVDFEDASKGSYGSGTVTLNGLNWNMTDALIGTLSLDWKNGLRSCRFRGFSTSIISMIQDKEYGLGTLTFFYNQYSADPQVQWIVEYSMNGGASWTSAGTFTATAAVQQFSAVINQPGFGRIRIRHNTGGDLSTNRRANVDDIFITQFIL